MVYLSVSLSIPFCPLPSFLLLSFLLIDVPLPFISLVFYISLPSLHSLLSCFSPLKVHPLVFPSPFLSFTSPHFSLLSHSFPHVPSLHPTLPPHSAFPSSLPFFSLSPLLLSLLPYFLLFSLSLSLFHPTPHTVKLISICTTSLFSTRPWWCICTWRLSFAYAALLHNWKHIVIHPLEPSKY